MSSPLPLRSSTAVLLLVVGLVGVGLHPRAAAAADEEASSVDPPGLLDVRPPAGGIVPAGDVMVSARGTASLEQVALEIDGTRVAHRATVAGGHTEVEADVTLPAGSHVAEVRAVVDGRPIRRAWTFTVSDVDVDRLAGDDRHGTAAAIAGAVAGGRRVPAAVLVRADGVADAVPGVVLAHVAGGVLLPTSGDTLDAEARQVLRRHVASEGRVYVLGGGRALGREVADQVAALDLDVVRLAGRDRYETAARVADEVHRLAPPAAGEPVAAVVASGTRVADALTMSAPAAREGWPVLLTDGDQVPPPTRAELVAHDVDRVEVAGGPAAVPEGVAAAIRALPTAPDVRRTGGEDRHDTAAAIAERFSSGDEVVLASGQATVDALAGGVLAAAIGAPLLLTAERLAGATAAAVSSTAPARLLVLGGTAAVPDRAVEDALRGRDGAHLAGRMSPPVGATIDLRSSPVVRIDAGTELEPSSTGSVWADGREVPVEAAVDGDVLTLTIGPPPSPPGAHERVVARVQVVVSAPDGTARHADVDYLLTDRPPLRTTPEGWQAVSGEGEVAGTAGPVHRYSLEVEPATGVDPHDFAAQAEAILSDPRGWTADDSLRLQRVAPGDADIRVLLARPKTVDALCGEAGLHTAGVYSCWTGRIAALNLDRWIGGAAPFDAPLDVYRSYLVNHEVGHGLGHGHRSCPQAGRPAPVMMQQTKGTGACLPNPWPFP